MKIDVSNQFREIILRDGIQYYDELRSLFDNTLQEFINDGTVCFEDHRFIVSRALEIEVERILVGLDFKFTKNGDVDCDLIINAQDSFINKTPIVVEIKSGKSFSPSRHQLRQLDDWVFELSGEAKARKEGLGKGGPVYDPQAKIYGSNLIRQPKLHHPTPHKGLMIYNNSEGIHFTGVPFTLGYNELEFCKKRNFCVMSFSQFYEITTKIKNDEFSANSFWTKIHNTQGVYN